jgi:hypothetical protein
MTSIYGRTWIGHSNSQAPLEVRREAFERMAGHALARRDRRRRRALSRCRGVEEAWQRQAQGRIHKLVLIP